VTQEWDATPAIAKKVLNLSNLQREIARRSVEMQRLTDSNRVIVDVDVT